MLEPPTSHQAHTRIHGSGAAHDAMVWVCRHKYGSPRTTVTIKGVSNWKIIHKKKKKKAKLWLYEISHASKSVVKFVLSVHFRYLFSSCWNHLTHQACIKCPPFFFRIQHVRMGSIKCRIGAIAKALHNNWILRTYFCSADTAEPRWYQPTMNLIECI